MSLPIIIGITQSVVDLPERQERRDELDQAWIPFLDTCGIEPLLIPNTHSDPAEYARRMGAKGIVLTGGNNISDDVKTNQDQNADKMPNSKNLAPERDKTEIELLKHSFENRWPVIGICRGMQLLNLFYGGEIALTKGHAGEPHDIITGNKADPSFPLAFDKTVNSFHDFGIIFSGVSSKFQILAWADNVIEAFIHDEYPFMGIMWHPERNSTPSPNDVNLFRYFLIDRFKI